MLWVHLGYFAIFCCCCLLPFSLCNWISFFLFLFDLKLSVKNESVNERVSHVWLFVTPWIVTNQASRSMEFSRQEYWGGLSCPSPVDLPDPGIEPGFPALQAVSLSSEPWRKPLSLLIVEDTTLSHMQRWSGWEAVNIPAEHHFAMERDFSPFQSR